MVQQVITIIIIAIAAFIAGRSFYLRYWKKNEDDPCHGCGSSCGGCPVMELKDSIEQSHPSRKKQEK